eukprot:m.215996 g.215996  ORF g.215996 m.215996 type:complete len:647 (+) comp39847_c0_seq2:55-1995(+)
MVGDMNSFVPLVDAEEGEGAEQLEDTCQDKEALRASAKVKCILDESTGGKSRFLSRPVQKEIGVLLSLAWPVILTFFLQFTLPMSCTLICGHIGKTELDSVGLAVSITNVTGWSVAVGIASACDTLFSQAVGAGNKKEVSTVLQKGILILTLVCIPIFGIWLNIESLLLLLHVAKDVARLAGIFSEILIFGLPGNVIYLLLQKFLQNQGIVKAPLVVGFVIVPSFVLVTSLLIFVFHLGVEAAAASLSFFSTLQPIVLIFIMRRWNLGLDMWKGWSWECIYDWKPYIMLAIPGLLMLCLEWWSYEIGILVTGAISELESAAFIISFNLVAIFFMIPLGISVAASIRVGNLLGANKPVEAKRSAWVAYGIAVAAAVFSSALILSSRQVLGWIYSSDQKVVDVAAKLLIFLGVSELFDYTQATLAGVYRGAGRQMIASVFNFIGYYVIGLPIGIPLALLKLGGMGMWIGLLCGVVFQSVSATIYVSKFDWPLEAKKAQDRVGVDGEKQHDSDSENERNSEKQFPVPVVKMSELPSDDSGHLLSPESTSQNNEVEVGYWEAVSRGRSRRNFRRVLLQRIILLSGSLLIFAAFGVASNFHPAVLDSHCVNLTVTNGSKAVNSSCVNGSWVELLILPSATPTPLTNISFEA